MKIIKMKLNNIFKVFIAVIIVHLLIHQWERGKIG
jgi:hypothetical protein